MSASLENQFISDRYTSLLHLSGSNLTDNLDFIYDGLGNQTPIQVSNDTVVINNVEQPPSLTNSTVKFFDLMFPVNSIYLTADNTNPTTRFSGTTWELVSEGRYLAGVGTGSDKNGLSKTITEGSNSDSFGEYEHTLTEAEMPRHDHDISTRRRRYGRTNGSNRDQSGPFDPNTPVHVSTSFEGDSQSHNNTPPYFGVYVWKRTS